MLDAMGATAEGFDAAFSKPREQVLVLDRRRPPRVISGDGKLLPLVRDGSTKQSRIEEIGQALLKNTLLSASKAYLRKQQLDGAHAVLLVQAPRLHSCCRRLGRRCADQPPPFAATWLLPASVLPADSYEEHFVLPDDRVALLSNRAIMLVVAPGFAQLDGAAEIGARGAPCYRVGWVDWVLWVLSACMCWPLCPARQEQ